LPGGTWGHVLVTEFRGMALNGLFCADVLRPLDLSPLTDFTYKYHPDFNFYLLSVVIANTIHKSTIIIYAMSTDPPLQKVTLFNE